MEAVVTVEATASAYPVSVCPEEDSGTVDENDLRVCHDAARNKTERWGVGLFLLLDPITLHVRPPGVELIASDFWLGLEGREVGKCSRSIKVPLQLSF